MGKSNFILFVAFLLYNNLCAQTKSYKNNSSISIEIGKCGLLLNVAVDHKFNNKNYGLRANIGSNFNKYLNAISTGIGGFYLIGKQKRYFELGVDVQYFKVDKVSDDQKGFTILYTNYPIQALYKSLNIGFRKYNKNNLFRVGLSPGFIKDKFVPGGYISYGFTF